MGSRRTISRVPDISFIRLRLRTALYTDSLVSISFLHSFRAATPPPPAYLSRAPPSVSQPNLASVIYSFCFLRSLSEGVTGAQLANRFAPVRRFLSPPLYRPPSDLPSPRCVDLYCNQPGDRDSRVPWKTLHARRPSGSLRNNEMTRSESSVRSK